MASPSSWSGFGASKERLKIEQDDVMISDGPNGPIMKLSPKLKEQLYKPWANALILNNIGRAHTLTFMITKLSQKWTLIGQWQLTDLGEGYFVARFQMKEDLDYVLTSGPWIIANQYLVVQRWKPNFVPGEDTIQSMPIWVRLSKLPMEWMDAELLWSIGGMLGKMCKVDLVTEIQARGRFARISVEIDISIPLLGTLNIEDRSIRVEYESLGLVCFKCGRYGHSKDSCKEGLVDPIDEDTDTNCHSVANVEKEASTYPWLLVSYGRQGNINYKGMNGKYGSGHSGAVEKNGFIGKPSGNRNFNMRKTDGEFIAPNLAKNYLQKNGSTDKNIDRDIASNMNRPSGSRFDVLNEELDMMMAEGEDTGNNKTAGGRQHKGKAVLTKITNQKNFQGKKATKVPPHGSKKTPTNGGKLVTKIGQMAESRGNAIPCKGITGSKNISHSPKSASQDVVVEDLDNGNVLRQLYSEVTDFEANTSMHKEVGACLNQSNLSVSTSHLINSFDVVAFELGEAMEVISE
ncbi:hypothetical protein Dsin_027141 [Dipteronia sinensis]|uniref:CCHC-type domain-containing protein n=1 Tax=Dipteronia sinensis TaxID=43782 RepID=A0AAD9ZZL1_9ROSI|nr:hypothetical protein Dsin_027141 [Dipteronia sinensis]